MSNDTERKEPVRLTPDMQAKVGREYGMARKKDKAGIAAKYNISKSSAANFARWYRDTPPPANGTNGHTKPRRSLEDALIRAVRAALVSSDISREEASALLMLALPSKGR